MMMIDYYPCKEIVNIICLDQFHINKIRQGKMLDMYKYITSFENDNIRLDK